MHQRIPPLRQATPRRWRPRLGRAASRRTQTWPARAARIRRWRGARAVWIGRCRLLAVVMAAVVVVVTGYSWATLHQLSTGLATSDVIAGGAAPSAPADGALDILLVGMDSRTDSHGNPLPADVLAQLHAGDNTGELNTDTLILLRIPTDPARPAAAFSLPRDSYVAIPGYGQHKLNSAYARATTDAQQRLRAAGVSGAALDQQSRQAGRRELVATVQALSGVTVDHYAELNLAGFVAITQLIGGVPVCLNAAVHDDYSGANFPAGPQTVQGGAALAFVRQRHGLPRGDLDRVVRQQVFLAGLSHQLLAAGTLTNPAKLSALIDAVTTYVVLDQGFDLLGFTAQAPRLTGDLAFAIIPIGRAELPTPEDGQAVAVDPAQVRTVIRAAATTAPTDSPSVGSPAGAPVAVNAATTVDVRNATTVDGLAERVLTQLTDTGFTRGQTSAAARRVTSVVRYTGPAQRDAADRIAAELGGLYVEADPTLAAGRVQVTLGSGYTGPGRTAAPRSTSSAPPTPPVPAPPVPSVVASPSVNGAPCVN